MAFSGHVGAIFVETSDAPITFTKKSTTADNTYKRYTINDATLRYWDKKSLVLVYVNDIEVTGGFEIEYCGGTIAFESAMIPEDIVTVSGKSLTVSQRGGFFNWSCELSADTADITTFSSGGWKENLPTIKGFTASAESYWGDSEFFQSLGKEVVIALYVDNGVNKKRYEGFAVISSDSVEAPADDIINESIEFEGTEKLYYRED